MGGRAFANARAEGEPTLRTPRMKPEEYARLKADMTTKLVTYFADDTVVCLKEAPEKLDYGDVDFLVSTRDRVDWVAVANAVGAIGLIIRGSGNVRQCSLAMRKNATINTGNVVQYTAVHSNDILQRKASDIVSTEEYAQVDIEVVPPERFRWFVFYSSYSDMAGLLGHIVTNLGFTVSDKGLYLRLQELDDSKDKTYINASDKEGVILLSSNPSEVMEFLGLSVEEFEAGFKTLDAFYGWLRQCRVLKEEFMRRERKKAHERQRENTRNVFSRFFREWLPTHRKDSTSCDWANDNSTDDGDAASGEESSEDDLAIRRQQRRSELREEALEFFNKRAEYDEKHARLVRKIQNGVVALLLKPMIAKHSGLQDKQLRQILRAFRRYIGFRDFHPFVCESPHSDEDAELYRLLGDDRRSLREPEKVEVWVKENWAELRSRERHRRKKSELVAHEAV